MTGLRFPFAVYQGTYPELHDGLLPQTLIRPTQAWATQDLGCSLTRSTKPHPYSCPSCGEPLYRGGGENWHHKRAYFWHGTGGTCAEDITMQEAIANHQAQEVLRQFDHAIWTGACPEAHEGMTPDGLVEASRAHETADLRHVFGLPRGEHAYRCPDTRCNRPVYKAGNQHHGHQRPHFRHVGGDESCAPGGSETKLHFLLKHSIARVLNAREGIHASVERALHESCRIVPDVTVTFDDGSVVYVEVVVHHRPEHEVVPILAPNLIVVRALGFPLSWVHQTDQAACAVADAVETLRDGLDTLASGEVNPSLLPSEPWVRWGRSARGRFSTVPQFLDVLGNGCFTSMTKECLVGYETVAVKVGEEVTERPIMEWRSSTEPAFMTVSRKVRTRYPKGARKVTERGSLRQKTETVWGSREEDVTQVVKYHKISRRRVRVGTEYITEDVMGEEQHPVHEMVPIERFSLGSVDVLDLRQTEGAMQPLSLEDCDLLLPAEEAIEHLEKAVMVHANRTLATELQERLTAYEQAEEAP